MTYRLLHKTVQDIIATHEPITSFERGAYYLAAKLDRWYWPDACLHRKKLELEGKTWDEEAFLDSEVLEEGPVPPERPIVFLSYWGNSGPFAEPAYFIGMGYPDAIRSLDGLYVYARVEGMELARTLKAKS